ncbi:GNAT family N-acetyltransferase [Streptomyces sp. TRM 70351]|uniref:GNAT family N-acetyltransferase n=1 Tax=Streptomyces sp. TRM 70351 TaxID=3116552 RepID=UPI002E7AE98A|nr:GNAT family N-acetyltransferase [Streptomyces sp. TRM 70351]MEE1929606.1 GNAT family N-acetyltransferase [Streptomyces sp. TRM 70351]
MDDTRQRLPLPDRLLIEGHGLVLREWSEADLPDLAELYDDPQMARWTPAADPFDAEAARAYLARAREARAQGERVQLAITTDGGRARGEVLMFRCPVDARDVELGYGVAARHRRQGLAARAVRALADHATGHVGARRTVLRIEARNTASEAVAAATGFLLTDEEPVYRDIKGRPAELRTWSRPAA